MKTLRKITFIIVFIVFLMIVLMPQGGWKASPPLQAGDSKLQPGEWTTGPVKFEGIDKRWKELGLSIEIGFQGTRRQASGRFPRC